MAQQENQQLTQMLLNILHARALCTLADLGVADHIAPGSPRSAAYLAQATGAHERSLYRVLRLLASHGVFTETADGRFDHTGLSAALRSDSAGSFHAGARMFHHLFAALEGLDHTIRTGETGIRKVLGKELFELLQANPALAPIFDAGMTSYHGHETGAMLAAYDFSGINVLADIGGGNGSLLAGVLERYPRMRGILFDLAHVTTRTRQSPALKVLGERCQVIEGDFFETVPGGADGYLLRHILHDWTDAQCATILAHCRHVLPPHGRLLTVECVVPADNSRSISKDYDILMMVGPGGLERTESQFRTLLAHCGFRVSSITPTTTMVSVIEARPA